MTAINNRYKKENEMKQNITCILENERKADFR